MIMDEKSAFEWLSTLPADYTIHFEYSRESYTSITDNHYRLFIANYQWDGQQFTVYGNSRLEAIQKAKQMYEEYDTSPVHDAIAFREWVESSLSNRLRRE